MRITVLIHVPFLAQATRSGRRVEPPGDADDAIADTVLDPDPSSVTASDETSWVERSDIQSSRTEMPMRCFNQKKEKWIYLIISRLLCAVVPSRNH